MNFVNWVRVGPIVALVGAVACGEDDEDQTSRTFSIRIENRATSYEHAASGAFDTPEGASSPGAITPGQSYVFSFNAAPGMKLHLATMFIPSNDFFYAPSGSGISLFDPNNMPVTGDVSDQISLWDAGTEANQEPGLGSEQPMNGMGNTPDTNDQVRLAPDTFANLPSVDQVLALSLAATQVDGAYRFTATLTNISDSTTLENSDEGADPVPLSPGVFVVTTQADPLFTSGAVDRGLGLKALAESGDPSGWAGALAQVTGVTVLASPGVWAVGASGTSVFESGQADSGMGLEAIAEDGSPAALDQALSGFQQNAVFNTPDGASSPAPIGPSSAYAFNVTARPGEVLHLVSMVVPSNDWFFAFGAGGLALFDADGDARSGDFSSALSVWDLGTEVDQSFGFGLDQVQNQAGPNTGAADPDTAVRVVTGSFAPTPAQVLRLTVTPQPL